MASKIEQHPLHKHLLYPFPGCNFSDSGNNPFGQLEEESFKLLEIKSFKDSKEKNEFSKAQSSNQIHVEVLSADSEAKMLAFDFLDNESVVKEYMRKRSSGEIDSTKDGRIFNKLNFIIYDLLCFKSICLQAVVMDEYLHTSTELQKEELSKIGIITKNLIDYYLKGKTDYPPLKYINEVILDFSWKENWLYGILGQLENLSEDPSSDDDEEPETKQPKQIRINNVLLFNVNNRSIEMLEKILKVLEKIHITQLSITFKEETFFIIGSKLDSSQQPPNALNLLLDFIKNNGVKFVAFTHAFLEFPDLYT